MEKSNKNQLSRAAKCELGRFDSMHRNDSDSELIEKILNNPDEFRLINAITNWSQMNHFRNANILISHFLKKPELSVYYNGWQNIAYYHWEILFLTKLPIYFILAKNFFHGRIALLFYDKENIYNFTEWDNINDNSIWLDLLDMYPELSGKCNILQKVRELRKMLDDLNADKLFAVHRKILRGMGKPEFISRLSPVSLKTFPSFNGKKTITGKGLNSKNGFQYVRKNALVTLPFTPIYETYLHFYRRKEIISEMVEEQLGTYKSYASFWMALMLAMGLAIRNATNPNAIDM